MKICNICLNLESRPRISFRDSTCNACINANEKSKINWQERKDQFLKICDEMKNYAKKTGNNYHCIVPWSGGKDSSSIALKLKEEYSLNPLLVTFSPLIQNKIGEFNRKLMIDKNFDSILFSPNGRVAKKLAKRFFIERGNPKIAWDAGINAIPVKSAINHKIPYIFYAEHGESEYGGLVLDENSKKIRNFTEVIEHQIGDYPQNWVSDEIKSEDLEPYIYPEEEIINKNNLKVYYFSYFFKWSMYENYKYIEKNLPGFKTDEFGRSQGTFTNFDSLDDKIDDLYYYMQYIKFGFGRCVRDVCRYIQNDHLDREKGLEYVLKYDGEFPSRNHEEVLKYLDLDASAFNAIVNKHRNDEIWDKKNSSWKLKFNIN